MATLPQITPSAPHVTAPEKPARRRADSHRPSYACPRCLSSQVVAQPDTDPWEWLINRLGIRNMYCRQCSHKFVWL